MKIIDVINWILIMLALGAISVICVVISCLLYDVFNGKLYRWKVDKTDQNNGA